MAEPETQTPLQSGVEIIKHHLKTLPDAPGVYRMRHEDGSYLYIGKAKSLKNRVANYTRPDPLPMRLKRMISETRQMEFTICNSEVEALLMEASLIKQEQPRYNILLKDDKAYPYILITKDHEYPQLTRHRGAQKRKGQYFGPFISADAVRQTNTLIQKVFQLRPCTDSYFENRTRPCLQHQIKRCSAPCTGEISKEDYKKSVNDTVKFLMGDVADIRSDLTKQMQTASDDLRFEEAAAIRDRIQAMNKVQAYQDINLQYVKECDVIAVVQEGQLCVVEILMYRMGRFCGNTAMFPKGTAGADLDEIISAFLLQFYANMPASRTILLNHDLQDKETLSHALSHDLTYTVSIETPQRGERKGIMQKAYNNAVDALRRKKLQTSSNRENFKALATIMGIDSDITRVEVYDNSHIQGTSAIGAMIVAGVEGFENKHYRKFNIKTESLTAGDDYAMMTQVLTRRLKRADDDSDKWQLPDVLMIDGGRGQLSSVTAVLDDLNINIPVIAVAKGEDRNAGKETLYMPNKPAVNLPLNDPLQYFIQRLRDESHRYAIGTHRKKRDQNTFTSILDQIPGIGAKRKKALLLHFGSARAVKAASVQDIQTVDGISKTVAQAIYDFLHD